MKNDHSLHKHNNEPGIKPQPQDADQERLDTDLAWQRMQKLLMNETPHDNWATWEADATARQEKPALTDQSEVNKPSLHLYNNHPQVQQKTKGMNTMNSSSQNDSKQQESSASSEMIQRKALRTKRRRWATGIAACVVAGTVLATPFGNQALASILNQFRMQDFAAVNSQDLDKMEKAYDKDGINPETINRFGTFSKTYGKIEGDHTADEAIKLLGYKSITATKVDGLDKHVLIMPSMVQSLRLNTDAVNEAIQRLGGTTLLPEEANHKLITLTLPETISYRLIPIQEEQENVETKWADLYQQRLPQLNLDPSMNAEKVFEAIAALPLLPDDIRAILQKDQLLKGEIPIPVITDAPLERLDVDGVSVLIEKQSFSNSESDYVYNANWISGDEMYTLNGNNGAFPDKAALLAKVKELIHS